MIVISPYSQKLRNGGNNAKNYPYWQDVVDAIVAMGHDVVQIGLPHEEPLRGAVRKTLNLQETESLVGVAETWASVDNFLPHMMNLSGKPGVVVFGKSDPEIFGYPQNANLLLDRIFLRPNQFDVWENEPFDPSVFVPAGVVVAAIASRIKD